MKRGTLTHDKKHERKKKKSKTPGLTSKVLITCDYCHKDITQSARVQCAACAEFDLCVECFSAGVELRGHKYWHNYRMIEDLRFPFLSPDWSVQEEQLLLEALELFGISNWSYISDYVSSKDSEQCRLHYEQFYLESPNWPIISWDSVCCEVRPHLSQSKRSRCPQLSRKQRRAAGKKQAKKLNHISISAVNVELSGYMPKRREFECEWDDDCEKKIMDIEFGTDDTPEEFELKMELLEVYNERLSKRHAMRKLAVEKRLHDKKFQQELKKARSPQEQKLHKEMKKFLQIMDANEYEEFLKDLVREQELEKQVRDLQEYKAAGLTKMEQIEQYNEDKKSARRSRSRGNTPPASPISIAPPSPFPLTRSKSESSIPLTPIKAAPADLGPKSPMTRSRSKFQANPVEVEDNESVIMISDPTPRGIETSRKSRQFSGQFYPTVTATEDAFASNLNYVVAVI